MKTSITSSGIGKTLALLTLAICAFALVPSPVYGGPQVPFRATWQAQIEITPLDEPLVAVVGSGGGLGSHLGRMAAHSVNEVVNLATGEGVADYIFMAANGDEVHVLFLFLAIPSSPGVFSIQGTWQVTGGTGRFIGASGSGGYSGVVAFTGPVTALGSFELSGAISSPGTIK